LPLQRRVAKAVPRPVRSAGGDQGAVAGCAKAPEAL
jgi:hypothetical protein